MCQKQYEVRRRPEPSEGEEEFTQTRKRLSSDKNIGPESLWASSSVRDGRPLQGDWWSGRVRERENNSGVLARNHYIFESLLDGECRIFPTWVVQASIPAPPDAIQPGFPQHVSKKLPGISARKYVFVFSQTLMKVFI
jgi:hypothetical protein